MSFNFGAPKTTASTGFSLGGGDSAPKGLTFPAPTTAQAGTGFAFGAPQTTAPSTGGANFGLGSTLTGGLQGFSGFAAPPASTTTSTASQGFSFGASGFRAAATSTTQSGFSSGGIATSQPQAPSFGLGSTAPPAQPTSAGFLGSNAPQPPGFGLAVSTPQSQAPTFNLGGAPATSATTAAAPGLNFGLGATAKTTATATFPLSTASTAAPTVPSSGFSFSGPAATTATSAPAIGSALSFGVSTASASSGLSLSTSGTAVSTVPGALSFSAPTTSAAIAPTSSAPASAVPAIVGSGQTFAELEEAINKWTLELEEQEKVFMNQALQLNAWDRLLITNGEKVLELNSIVERVKEEQQHLEHELDFTVAQQRELEECIAPLEKELANIPVTDHDRQRTYQLAEHMDSQLKQMSEDLKEIIEHLNETSKAEDSNDPIVQIGRILNAHMNSLQWIDRNTALISSQLDQITKLHETHRREQERSFHLIYE